MITRPNQERFNMSYEENLTFWLLVIAEYSHRYVRENSLLLYKNNQMVRTDEDA